MILEDILQGTLLPSITLAVKPDWRCFKRISKNIIVNILDGLQSTYILKELKESGAEFNVNRSLLVEFWLEEDITIHTMLDKMRWSG